MIGSGQSAAEIFADLLEHAAGRVDWFTRSSGFLPMEYSKLGLEHFSPEYTAYFHALPEERRDALRANQSLLYKGIDAGTSERIYDLLYRRSVDGTEPNVRYAARCELRGVEGRHRLHLHQLDQDVSFTHDADVVILATGYEPAPLPVPHGLLELDASGRPVVELDYRLRLADGSPSTLFVQNAELHTHGVGTPGPRARRASQRRDRQRAGRARGLRRARAATSSSPSARPRRRPPRRARSVTWERANRELIAKLLTELEFEELLQPEVDGDEWTLTLGGLALHYRARRRSLGHARVDPSSLRATRDGVEVPLPDAVEVVAIGAPALGVDPSTTAGLIGEISSTLLSDVHQLSTGGPRRS